MSLPRYAEYKDSGVEWLGQIPKHWGTMQSRRMFAVRSEPALPTDQMLTASQKHGVLFQADFMELEGRRVVEVIMGTESLKHVEPDDFIISMRSFQGGIEWCKLQGSTSFHYVMLRPVKHVWPPYFAHLLKSSIYIQALRRTTDLIRDGQELRFSNFAQVALPVVPLPEQKTIAVFLERETAKIDALIAEQEKLITLLTEKRQATISHAVTKGLNPNAPTKDTGVAWLGEVPMHWTVRRLRFVAELNPSRSELAGIDRATEVSFLPMEAIGDDGSITLERTRPLAEVETGYTYFRDGDVTLAKITPCFENGKGALMQGLEGGIGFGTTELIVARPKPSQVLGQMLSLIFRSPNFRAQGEASMYGAGGQKRVPDDFVRDLAWSIPPLNEQAEIAAFISREVAKLTALETEAESAIALLKERRSALIAAVVTGQIDVRGAVTASAATREELAA